MSQLFLISLLVQSTATLFLFLVFLVLFRQSRQCYFAYWTAAWFSLGAGLLALVFYSYGVREGLGYAWRLLAVYHVSLGTTALLAFFARRAFLGERPVSRWAWLLFAPVCAYLALSAGYGQEEHWATTLPRHLFLAVGLWASGSPFWRLARRERKPGAGFLAVAFALWGLQQAHYAVASLFLQARSAPYLEWVGFVDTALVLCVALGMVLFALDEDRARLLESNRKLEISEQQLKDLAMRDPLTGLFNRRHFDHVAAQLEAQAQRISFPLTVFVVDLNRFKETNDREGHARGDQVLRAVAEFLRRETRASDLPFRWGGDEFLLLLTDLAREDVESKAAELRERWQRVAREIGTDVSLALGWATLGPEGLEATIRKADRLMYADKRVQQGPALAASA